MSPPPLSQDTDLSVRDPCSDVTLRFTNPVDALVARLRLETALGPTFVDLFLQLPALASSFNLGITAGTCGPLPWPLLLDSNQVLTDRRISYP